MIRKPLFLLLWGFNSVFCFSQPPEEDFYNLKFKYSNDLNFKWKSQSVAKKEVDSSQLVQGKYPVCFSQLPYPFPGFQTSMPLFVNLIQTIYVPEKKKEGKYHLSINSKCLNLPKAHLIIYTLDDNENILFADTIDIGHNEWEERSLRFDSGKECCICIQVEAYGRPSNLFSNPGKKNKEEKLWIDKISLKMGDFDFKNFTPNLLPSGSLNRDSAVPLLLAEDDLNCQRLSKGARITALGETIHGSEDLNELAARIIKNRIIHDQCKVVIMEVPIDLGLKWNLFVQGNSSFGIDEIVQDISMCLLSTKAWTNFFIWLKAYNESTIDKVRICGMRNINQEVAINPMIDYLYELKVEKEIKDSLLFYFDRQSYQKVYEIASINLKNRMEKTEYQLLMQSLGFYKKRYSDMKKYLTRLRESDTSTEEDVKPDLYALSDSIQYVNTEFIVDSILKKEDHAIIFAHYMHVNKRNTTLSPMETSSGGYLYRKYGNDYSVIGLFAGEGTTTSALANRTVTLTNLEQPPAHSLEYECSMLGLNCFYYPGSTSFFLSRIIGAYNTPSMNQFNIFSLKDRMDGFIFVKKVTGFSPLKNKENSYSKLLLRRQK